MSASAPPRRSGWRSLRVTPLAGHPVTVKHLRVLVIRRDALFIRHLQRGDLLSVAEVVIREDYLGCAAEVKRGVAQAAHRAPPRRSTSDIVMPAGRFLMAAASASARAVFSRVMAIGSRVSL